MSTAAETLNQANKQSSDTMAPTHTTRRGSPSPPPHSSKHSSQQNIWTSFEKHDWHLGMPQEPPREPFHFHRNNSQNAKSSSSNKSAPRSREHSAPPSGATTPERQAHADKQSYNFFKHLNERLDRAYARTESRPEADRVVEEARAEGEQRQGRKGGDLFRFVEGRLDRAYEHGRLRKQ